MRVLFIAAMFALVGCGQAAREAPAQETEPAPKIEIHDAWAAPTPGGVDVSAGYLVIENTGDAEDRLVSVSSQRAARVEIHEMAMDGAVMRMRPVENLTVSAGGRVDLAPSSQHLMFFGVTQPFTEGEQIPVRLTFERSGERDISLPVHRGATHGEH